MSDRFSKELVRRFKTPQAVLRRLGMDENVLSGTSAEVAREKLLDLIDDLATDAVPEFGELIRKLAGDSRGVRRWAKDEREKMELPRNGLEESPAARNGPRAEPGEERGYIAAEQDPDVRRVAGLAGDRLAYDRAIRFPNLRRRA